MIKVQDNPKRETLTRPPGKWFNWYRVTGYGWDLEGKNVDPGEAGIDPRPWPTREVAEQKHLDLLRECAAIREKAEYLGAYPEGVTP